LRDEASILGNNSKFVFLTNAFRATVTSFNGCASIFNK